MGLVLDLELMDNFKSDFYADNKNVLAQNMCSKMDPLELCLSRKFLQEVNHVYEYKQQNEGKPVTNQRQSGRCWIFAALNVIRLPFMKHLKIDNFEFSEAHLFFWDKIERCNYFLNNLVEVVKRGEAVDGRLVSFLLKYPCIDGGQYNMIVNLVNKYGLMPKRCFPESFSCGASAKMNSILRTKLREYAKVVCDLLAENGEDEQIQNVIKDQMGHIYRIVGICLGIPNKYFTFRYRDNRNKFHQIGPITPKDFYEKHVKPVFNFDDKVCLVTDCRSFHEYGKLYTVDCLNNMTEGQPCLYNNQPVKLLLDLAARSVKEGQAVWFSCEISKRFSAKHAILDLRVRDFSIAFGLDIELNLDKADRLVFGDGAMSHAMILTAVSFHADGEVSQFKVENSWGEHFGDRGCLTMSADWFKEFVFEVVVDKKYIPQEVLSVFEQEPVVLPAWDPMGTLAGVKSGLV